MKFTPLLVCIFVLVCDASSKDLMCYSCFYFDGHNSSDSSCLTNPSPSMLKNCTSPKIPGLEYNISDSAILKNGILKCSNYTGTLNEKKIVILGCELIDYPFDCVRSGIDIEMHGKDGKKYTASVSLHGVNVTNAEACFCQNDYCNGPHMENPTSTSVSITTQRSHATGSHLTSHSLFTATIVYVLYKCVS